MNEKEKINFIQKNSPDGGFLQSDVWCSFQEAVGRKTYGISSDYFHANIIEHNLPIVGKYFYVPRGPVVSKQETVNGKQYKKLIELAKDNNARWIRVEPATEEILGNLKENIKYKTQKAPHDMQPREIFVIDIVKPEEQLLAEMKSKTRYNIRLAIKKGVKISNYKYQISQPKADPPMAENKSQNSSSKFQNYIKEFLRLVKVTARRDGIVSHPESYYRKMIETIPGDILKLYVAEYKNKIIAANLVVFYGDTCTYLHGASDDEHRNVMAPHLLQWQQIKDAKAAGCKKYDFGGINTKTGEGITRFKLAFSPVTEPTRFPGCYDIVISLAKYWAYRGIQKVKSLIK